MLCRSSMSSNSLVLHTSGIISSSAAAFLFLIFRSTYSSSSCVNCPSLMFKCLLIILVSCITFGDFPSKFSKYCFHRCVRSFSLIALYLSFAMLFFLHTSFTVCHAILDSLSSTESLILLIWFSMYSVSSFRHILVNSFCAFLGFWVLVLVKSLLLHLEAVFTSARFFLTANVSHGTLDLACTLLPLLSGHWWTSHIRHSE